MALFETPLGFADAGMGLKGVTRPNMKKQEVFACPGPDQEGVVFPLSTVLLFGEPEVISAVQLIWAQESWPNAEAKRQDLMVDLAEVISDVLLRSSSVTVVEDAIAKGGNVNASKDSVSVLAQAVQAKHAELVRVLLKNRASPTTSDKKGVTPLHLATFDGSLEILKSLISSRADLEAKDCHGQTPFFFVPNRRSCLVLGNAKADPNVLNHKGQTPLHLAAHAGLNDAVQWLAESMTASMVDAQE
ncbi:unnamed protein product [Durusdinium trenchii]|uniref:Uncharacterized protein n=1 Tax=Durusdinium trenchii TaxID=1381693 RepID=A0ABP0JVL0_9DINO